MRALVLFLEFGFPLLAAFGAGIASTLYVQRLLRRRDEKLRDELARRGRIAALAGVTTKELLDEIATRDDLTHPKDS